MVAKTAGRGRGELMTHLDGDKVIAGRGDCSRRRNQGLGETHALSMSRGSVTGSSNLAFGDSRQRRLLAYQKQLDTSRTSGELDGETKSPLINKVATCVCV